MNIKSESGQALPLAMMALAFGTLVIAPFLGHIGASLIGSRTYGDIILHQASCDAGIEHAIWSLTRGNLADQIPDTGDSTSYQLGETLNNLTTTVTVTANSTGGSGSAVGTIEDSILDSLEFDNSYGVRPDIIRVSENIYAIAYRGYGNDGFIRTIEIINDGQISNSVLDSLEFDNNTAYFPDLIQISADVFAVAYQRPGSDGFVKTVEINSNGNITNNIIDSLEFDTSNGREPDIIHVSGNIYAIAYRGNGNDGFIKTIRIISNGNITNSVVDSLEFDTNTGIYPNIVHISSDIYAVAYRGRSGDGYVKTIEIENNGNISNSVIDTLEFDTSNCVYPNIINVAGDVYAVAYQGSDNDGFLRTLQIASDGNISNNVIDSLEFDTGNGREPVINRVTSDVYAIVYRGNGNDGFVITVEIDSNGNITNSVIDSLEYDTAYGAFPDIIQIDGEIFAIAYAGPGTDGFVKTIRINTQGVTEADYKIVSTTGLKTITAFVSTDNVTVSIKSWQVDS